MLTRGTMLSFNLWVLAVAMLTPSGFLLAQSSTASTAQPTLLGVSSTLVDQLKATSTAVQRRLMDEREDASRLASRLAGERRRAEADEAIARIDELCREAARSGRNSAEIFRLIPIYWEVPHDQDARDKLKTAKDPEAMRVWKLLEDKGLRPKFSLEYEKPKSNERSSSNRQWVILATW